MKKTGTHWKPLKADQPQFPAQFQAMRPVHVVTLDKLQAQKASLEAELRELFVLRRQGKGGLPISRRSRQLREVKQQIAKLTQAKP